MNYLKRTFVLLLIKVGCCCCDYVADTGSNISRKKHVDEDGINLSHDMEGVIINLSQDLEGGIEVNRKKQ